MLKIAVFNAANPAWYDKWNAKMSDICWERMYRVKKRVEELQASSLFGISSSSKHRSFIGIKSKSGHREAQAWSSEDLQKNSMTFKESLRFPNQRNTKPDARII